MIEVGDWIRTTGGLRGRVIGEGTLTARDWPAWKIDIGDGRMMAILKERVDPTGQMNLEWRPVGNTRLEIRMPLPSKEAKARRDAWDAAKERLAKMNVRRFEVERALQEGGDRDATLETLVRGVGERGQLLDLVAFSYDVMLEAEENAAGEGLEADENEDEGEEAEPVDAALALVEAKADYETKMENLLAGNFPVQRPARPLSTRNCCSPAE